MGNKASLVDDVNRVKRSWDNVVDNIRLKVVETPEEMEAAKSLRYTVFVGEQGIPPEEETDIHDATAVHAIALLDGSVVGAGRMLTLPSGETQIGRMAVAPSLRRRGIGGLILRFLEEQAHKAGVTRVVLHAQSYVRPLYEQHGYVTEGEPFFEVDIEHMRMGKTLGREGR